MYLQNTSLIALSLYLKITLSRPIKISYIIFEMAKIFILDRILNNNILNYFRFV